MRNGSSQSDVVQLHDSGTSERKLSILAVGDPDVWSRQGHDITQQNLSFVGFDEISEATLEQHKPDVIISPVLTHEFDCIELTLLLRNLGYQGAYRAVAQDMPRPCLIEREVSQLYPELNFKINNQS